MTLGWSATAVLWLSGTPCPVPDHLFSLMATGDAAERWRAAGKRDWAVFLDCRAAEFRPGGQLVVSALVGDPRYVPWMEVVEDGGHRAVADGVIDPEEFAAMVIPTILRDRDGWVDAVATSGAPFDVVEHRDVLAPDPAFVAFRDHNDPGRFAVEATAAFRAWSEPVLMSSLRPDRTAGDRATTADAFYDHVRAGLEATPTENAWQIRLMRLVRH